MNTQEEALRKILDAYTPVKLNSKDLSLSEPVKAAIPHLKIAMDRIHEVFLAQQSEKEYSRILEMQTRRDTLGEFYSRFQGPWYPVEDFRSYDPEVPDRAPGCSFYPEDMTAEEFASALSALDDATGEGDPTEVGDGRETREASGAREASEPREASGACEIREALESPTTVVRRGAEGEGLRAIPYHQLHAEKLAEAFDALETAAEVLEEPSRLRGDGENAADGELRFAEYLRERAESLVAGTYRESDSAWVRLEGVPLELILGPYEVYDDALLGRKATYEGMLMVVDRERCDRLKEIEEHLGALAAAFPMPAGAKPAVGGLAPMVVVHQIYNAGESRQPIYPAAFNLPNDPWVRGNVGWKQVMLYNVMRAKFDTATIPIAHRILKEVEDLPFEPFFYEVILHEVSHGLGPAYRADGRSVDGCLGPHYTAIEEAKADTGGLFFLLEKAGTCGIPAFPAQQVLQGYVAAQFRAMRFGLKEAHGAANVIQHNWLLESGGIERTDDGYLVRPEQARREIRVLLEELCRLQAEAELSEAADFLDRWARPDGELQDTLNSLNDLPIDLFLEFE